MSIPLLMGLLLPLLAAPLATHRVFTAAFDRQKAQIASDNAAIVLAQGETRALDGLSAANRVAAAWEKVHHPLHACARIPWTRARCEPLDLAVERRLAALHAAALVAARSAWRAAMVAARAEAGRLGVPLARVAAPEAPPIRAERCAVCGQVPYWEIERGAVPLRAIVVPAGPGAGTIATRVQLRGESVCDEKSWRYLFELEDEP